MDKIIDAVLVVGFLTVDFFFFHDIFSEPVTVAQYLTGALSIIVIVRSARSLLQK